jgi:hypothetical protein
MVKKALIAIAVIVVGSLLSGIIGLTKPVMSYSTATISAYNHYGEFSHTEYTTTQASQTTAVLFPAIIDSLDMLFAYNGPESKPVTVRLYLADSNGSWEKEIPVQAAGENPLSFPLNLSQLLTTGTSINKEIGGRGNSYTVRVLAQVGTGASAFTMTLEGKLDATMLTWDETGFYRVERGYPGDTVLREAAFGYRAKLKDNSLYGPITIERTPDIPLLSQMKPGDIRAAGLVQSIDIGFNYRFASSSKVNSLKQDIRVTMTMAETGGWTETYELVPLTTADEVKLKLPIDVAKLLQIADDNDQAVGSRASVDRQITIAAQVHTVARTDAGVVDETFSQQLNGSIGKLVSWEDTSKAGTDQLNLAKSGKITTTVATTHTGVKKLRLISLIILILGVCSFAYLFFLYWRKRVPVSPLVKETAAIRRKYGTRIANSLGESSSGGENVVFVESMADLIKIADELGRPVMMFKSANNTQPVYYIIDGTMRYEFVLFDGDPGKPAS